LGAFCYLGRGWSFNDLEESTAISAETYRIFLHHIGNTTLYPQYVTAPQGAEEATTHMNGIQMAGFNGCVGSSDGTHIVLEKFLQHLKQNHMGGKLKLAT
jgi:hypothetical protein